MKKLGLLVLLFALAIIFSACGSNESRKSIITNFNSDFTAKKANFTTYGCIVTENGETELVFNQPQNINGMKIINGKGQLSIEIDNLISTADEAYLPSDSMPRLIHCIATEISDGREIFYRKNNEFDTYILETSKGKCTYTVDKNGYILSAEIKSKNFSIDFCNTLALN